jgi:hypothetical protein
MFGPKAGAAMAMLALVGSASLTGCRTVDGMRSAPLNEGVQRSYYGEYYDVTRAAYQAVESLGLTVDEVKQIDPATWHVIANSGVSAFSWGELVRVSVQGHPGMPVAVWVLTRRKVVTNITAKDDYSPDVFQRMDFTLRLQRSRAAPPP